jgi:hypothetical protein
VLTTTSIYHLSELTVLAATSINYLSAKHIILLASVIVIIVIDQCNNLTVTDYPTNIEVHIRPLSLCQPKSAAAYISTSTA